MNAPPAAVDRVEKISIRAWLAKVIVGAGPKCSHRKSF